MEQHSDQAAADDDSSQNLADSIMVAADEASAANNRPDVPIPSANEEDALRSITGAVRDQDEVERDITLQANAALIEAEDKKDRNRILKLETTRHRLQQQLDKEKKRLERAAGNPYQSRNIEKELKRIEVELLQINNDISDFNARILKRHLADPLEHSSATKTSKKLPGETNREYLIRTGKITPFANLGGSRPEGLDGQLAATILDAEEEAAVEQLGQDNEGPKSHQLLRQPGFADDPALTERQPYTAAVHSEFSLRPRKRKRVQRESSPHADSPSVESPGRGSPGLDVWQRGTEDALDHQLSRKAKAEAKPAEQEGVDISKIDDGNEAYYKKRLQDWVSRRSRARRARRQESNSYDQSVEGDEDDEEWFKPSPDHPDQVYSDHFKLPGDIHPSLFGYQKTGVQWLTELYNQNVGGIIGDEMGLGKTVQLIAFIAALHYSKRLKRPVLVVAPATLLRQWVSEFHRWWPPLRVAILHASGSGMMNVKWEDDYDVEHYRPITNKAQSAAKKIVSGVVKKGHVLVTTYTGLLTYADELLPVEWEYAVLDEGHKIRNPNAEITIACKELNTPNRLILSGTPVQNNLTELWSLFDFVYPMRLGTLVNFRAQFEIPIRQGGYANASNLQVMTAEKCAEALKETISQYLLQRLKIDVAADLPEKTEQVLFCKLTERQREAYETFLKSDEVSAILNRRRQSLYGIDVLRKICNHPDLLDKNLHRKEGFDFGNPRRSAKLQLTKDLLQKVMIPHGHKTLLFSQGKLMLNIIEKCIQECGISYVRMDGETPVDQRQPMIDRFNTDPHIHVFLMTTRTGGLGTNLTGADRIIIFDPDWNPSTDLQARERAWRLGQMRPVKIYRLMTEGTIEEKIYHRQIFKQFMTNKVLKDPKQRSSYDLSDLYDLFSYNPSQEAALQRSQVFKGAEVELTSTLEPSVPTRGSEPSKKEGIHTEDAETQELRQMNLVAAMENFNEDQSAHDERRILEGIFTRSVNSAYDHEQIVNGPQTAKADMGILQQEANQVARQAAAHLDQAAREAQQMPIGSVTWTGEVGTAGRPGANRRRGGPSSGSVLANLADRQGLGGGSGSGSSSRSGTPGIDRNLKAKDFVAMITTFIMRHRGRVPSKMLVDHFNPYCPNKKQSLEFKMALDQAAVLDKTGGAGRGVWTLRKAAEGGQGIL